ncbi:MAG: biotin--[acetyl-CoA-carboxylase] ligase [Deltaproteobacteria bacterium]|nr:biotin--[acetyl-CoA-carboxylase] ligase [Deltaproteobacteria bacterium]
MLQNGMNLMGMRETRFVAGNLIFSLKSYATLPSTNALAYQQALSGAAEGTVILSETQTAGKGRLGRTWFSPAKTNIYASLILRPNIHPQYASQIPLFIGIAVQQAISSHIPSAKLKWPNDILVGERKICGILCEMRAQAEKVDFVVVGMGINVNQTKEDLEETIGSIATSILMETGLTVAREELLKKVLARVAELYYRYQRFGFAPLKGEWLSLSNMEGKMVAVAMKDVMVKGRVVGIDDSGSLICRGISDELIVISAGDATIIKE